VRRIFAFVFVLLALLSAPAAFASQLGPRTNYTADQIQAAVERANGYNGSIMSQAGNLGMFESSGNSGIYNDTCCTGIFQINKSNLASYGLTPSQYANMSLDEQAQVWVNVTNSAAGAGSVKQLEQMQASGQKFDGQPVDSAMIEACIQLGTGNCQKMLNSGSCSGFQDSNGTSICDMANKIRNGSQTKEGQKTNNPTNNPSNPNAGASGQTTMDQPDIGDLCWACTAVGQGFSLINGLFTAIPDQLATKVAGLFAAIFAVVMAIQTTKHMLFLPQHGGLQQIVSLWVRFAIAMSVISIGSLYTTIIQEYALGPALGLGGYLGNQIMTIAMSAFGVS